MGQDDERMSRILDLAQKYSEVIVAAMDKAADDGGDHVDLEEAAALLLAYGAELEFYQQLFMKLGGNPAALAKLMGMAKARGGAGFMEFLKEIEGDKRVQQVRDSTGRLD